MMRFASSRQRGLGQKGKYGVLPHLSTAEAFPGSDKTAGSLRASRLEKQRAASSCSPWRGALPSPGPRQVKAPQKCVILPSPRHWASRARGRSMSGAVFDTGVGVGIAPKAPPVHLLVLPHPFPPLRGQGTPGAGRAGGGDAAGGGGSLPGEHLPRHPAGKGRFKPQVRSLFSPSCHGGGVRLAVRLGTRSLLTGTCVCSFVYVAGDKTLCPWLQMTALGEQRGKGCMR